MSELQNPNIENSNRRKQLLANASTAAMILSVCVAPRASAAQDQADQPQFWIELGGEFATHQGKQQDYFPPFLAVIPRPGFETVPPSVIEKPTSSSWDGTAKLSFKPAETNLTFSIGVQYGKSNRSDRRDQQPNYPTPSGKYNAYQNFGAQFRENHTVVDFRVGKDVGLGMFGSAGSSVVSLGLRYAQFNSRSTTNIKSQPMDLNNYYSYHRYYASFSAKRRFAGIGPSLSWESSIDVIGAPSQEGISVDWGLTGAVLFGKQSAKIHHDAVDNLHMFTTPVNHSRFSYINNYHHSASSNRGKGIAVPNIDAFAGVTWRYAGAKVTLGYRANMFFGAMDGGVDAREAETEGFYGPFVAVNIGIGG